MGRPPLHDHDSFLDAAARLFAAQGSRAVTMAAVARSIGAPSGSIYHRFPDRPALLAALWLRSGRRFLEGYSRVVGVAPSTADAVAASAWIVDWCRDNLAEAIVLQAGARTFTPDEWPESARAELAEHDAIRRQTLRTAVAALAEQTGLPHDRILFTLVDMPLAVVRPYFHNGEPPPVRATELARELAETLLTSPHTGS
ncbi:TetR/AcrR family transcriptional regulator [Nocardia caishijiensis]|uniref:TetR family transcriptional regulator n=1 Tax=Nocardia caishijiensis TaxID=184756 RepID=A0ABQ6YQS2_9NOCA|nr:TetR/AcrR family transcriptional regulator [Nocardia caishijiensis]KAF0847801.1 TetR family transcriptional regulator [Nocardia caishijiensis]